MREEEKIRKLIEKVRDNVFGLSQLLRELKFEYDIDMFEEIIDYLKETFESRTLNEITSHTGIGSMEIKGALATMQREGRIRISKVDGIIYYSLIQPS